MTKLVKYVKVTEDWYPTYADGTVRVFHTELHAWDHQPRMWRTAVWGNDDFGLEFDTTDQAKARALYDQIGDGITKQALLDLGFVYA